MSVRQVLLFDWGDTLMEDTPGMSGKMCDWPEVKAMPGAVEVLQQLAGQHTIYVATGAAESTEDDICRAFQRVGLDPFISGYFCRDNIGLSKPDPAFYQALLDRLQLPAERVVMIGDSLNNDIIPAAGLGIDTIWLGTDEPLSMASTLPDPSRCCRHLAELPAMLIG